MEHKAIYKYAGWGGTVHNGKAQLTPFDIHLVAMSMLRRREYNLYGQKEFDADGREAARRDAAGRRSRTPTGTPAGTPTSAHRVTRLERVPSAVFFRVVHALSLLLYVSHQQQHTTPYITLLHHLLTFHDLLYALFAYIKLISIAACSSGRALISR